MKRGSMAGVSGGSGVLTREWRLLLKNRELFLLALPGVLFKLIFNYLPLVGLVLAFKKYSFAKGIWGSDWVGWSNFEFFFISDTAYRITRNTILYNGTFIVLTTLTAIALAIMLNELSRRWISVHQTALFLPHFLSWVVVSYVTLAFLDQNSGFANEILARLGADPVKWYQESGYWPFILVAVNLWKSVGFSALIYYAGILGIDPSYYEAARIDGASKWQMIRKITVPMLTPLIVILFIMAIGGIFRADFGLFYFIPNDSSFLFASTDVIDTYVYRSLREVGNIGMSTAVGLYQSAVGFILVLAANWTVKKINADHALW